jgi:hypothetical protein
LLEPGNLGCASLFFLRRREGVGHDEKGDQQNERFCCHWREEESGKPERRTTEKLKRECCYLPRARVPGADLACDSPSFFFQRADRKRGASETFVEILLNKRIEPAAAFTLGDVNELMHEQFAIAPAIGANDDTVANPRAARSKSYDIIATRHLGESLVVRQRQTFDDQNSDAGIIPHANPMRILEMLRRQGRAILKDELLLVLTPLTSKR